MAKGGCRPPLVRLQNVVAGGGSDDGQRKRGPGEEDRDGGKRARGGGQLRGWTLESIQGEPASGGWRRGGWKAENLRPPLNSYRTSYRTSSRINVCTHAANTLVGKKWTRTRRETAKDSRGIFLNSVPVLERDPSIFRKRGRRNSPSPLLRKYRETILGIAFFDLAKRNDNFFDRKKDPELFGNKIFKRVSFSLKDRENGTLSYKCLERVARVIS